jgi:hypothetical protein
MSVPALTNEQYQFLDSGQLLNGAVAVPFFDVMSIDGLDSADVTPTSLDQTGRDGGYVDALYESIRTISIEGTVYASPTALEAYLDLLKQNFAPVAVDQPFYFKHDSDATVHMCMAKSLGFNYTKDVQRRLGIVDAQIQLLCQDPRIYSSTLQTMNVAIAGNNTMTLAGNRDTPMTFQLVGPLTNPITITYAGQTLTYNAAITAGHSVVIDTNARTAIYDGTINVRNSLVLSPTAKWPLFQPGNNLVALAAAGGTGNLVVTARAAWR